MKSRNVPNKMYLTDHNKKKKKKRKNHADLKSRPLMPAYMIYVWIHKIKV